MRLILRKDVDHLGDAGDIVEVADGYGLNHLIPKGLALHATASTVRAIQHEQRLRDAQLQAAKRGAEEFSGEFAGVELKFVMRAGEDGRLFGSVTNRQIEEALAERGLDVDRRRILLEEPIRKVGEYEVPVRLHQEVRAIVKVAVLPGEGAEAEAPKEEAEAPAQAATQEGAAVPRGEGAAAESPGGEKEGAGA